MIEVAEKERMQCTA